MGYVDEIERRSKIRRDGNLLLFLSHDVGRTWGRGCEERWKSRRKGGEPTTREKREGEVWIVALILCRD